MDKEDRAEAIATALIWLIGLALFAWSWQVSGSFIAALIVTAVGGFLVPAGCFGRTPRHRVAGFVTYREIALLKRIACFGLRQRLGKSRCGLLQRAPVVLVIRAEIAPVALGRRCAKAGKGE